MVDFYGFHVGKYTVRPMDPMGYVLGLINIVNGPVYRAPVHACRDSMVLVKDKGPSHVGHEKEDCNIMVWYHFFM